MENDNQLTPLQRRSKQEVRAIVEQWKQSGQSKARFCLENNFNYQTFFGWVKPKNKKNYSSKNKNPDNTSGFVPLKINDAMSDIFAEASFADGTKICFHQSVSAIYLRDLIR